MQKCEYIKSGQAYMEYTIGNDIGPTFSDLTLSMVPAHLLTVWHTRSLEALETLQTLCSLACTHYLYY